MPRYFKIIEIDADTFVKAADCDLDNSCELIIPVDGIVFVAVDDDTECEFGVPLDCFDDEERE